MVAMAVISMVEDEQEPRENGAVVEEKRMMTQLENSILASRICRFNNDLSDDMTGDNDEEEQAVMV